MICVRRHLLVQDLLRRHTVFIDGESKGRLWSLQSGRYVVPAGQHMVQLRVVNTGHSRSAEIPVSVRAGQTRVLRTRSLGFKSLLSVPLGIVNPDRFAPRPWIRLELEG